MTTKIWDAAGYRNEQTDGVETSVYREWNNEGKLTQVKSRTQYALYSKVSKRYPKNYPGTVSYSGRTFRKGGTYSSFGTKIRYVPGSRITAWTITGRPWKEYTGIDNLGYNPNDWYYPGLPTSGDERNQSIIECLNRLNEQKVNLGTYLAESLKSAEMLADAGINFLKLLQAAKRGKLPKGSPLSFGRGVNNASLQWQYGWRPLASDLYNLFLASKNGLSRPLLVTATRQTSRHESGKWNAVYGRPGTYTGHTIFKTKLVGALSSSFCANAQSYGLANPLALGWELVPYSFVLDWFMPIGSYLNALSATAGLDFIMGFTTAFGKGDFETELAACGKAYAERFVMDRVGYLTWPNFVSDFRPYSVSSPFNRRKAGIITQLIAQTRI